MITNRSDISLALAVWLLHDEYDYVKGVEKYISATSVMKPIRHLILPGRMDPTDNIVDVEDYIARTLGHALHDSVEKAEGAGGQSWPSLPVRGLPRCWLSGWVR